MRHDIDTHHGESIRIGIEAISQIQEMRRKLIRKLALNNPNNILFPYNHVRT